MGDDYLERLAKIAGKKKMQRFKKGYRRERVHPNASNDALQDQIKEFLKMNIDLNNDELVSEAMGAADSFMKYRGGNERNVYFALEGAKLYGRLGKGDRTSVKNRLLRAYEEDPKPAFGVYEGIKEFLENPDGKVSGGLEKQTLAITSGIGFLMGLFLLSPNITGNAVSNVASVTSNWIGAALFIFGIVGGYFYTQK